MKSAGLCLKAAACRSAAVWALALASGIGHVPPTIASPRTNLAATVRHAPALNGNARVEGSIHQLLGEPATLNGNVAVAGDWLVPGTPVLVLHGRPQCGGILPGTGDTAPAGYRITLNGGCSLGHLRTRIPAAALPAVETPANPRGTRKVTLHQRGGSIGDPATLRDLTLNGNAGQIALPPGTYGTFTANGDCGFTLGISGAAAPATYQLQGLNLNGRGRLDVVGPVRLRIARGFTAEGVIGTPDRPDWLEIELAGGGLTLNGSCTLHGRVIAPSGSVILNGTSRLVGTVHSDRLILNGGACLQGLGPANEPPVADAGPDQLVNLGEDAFLNGFALDDGRPLASALGVEWSLVSGPGFVSFAESNQTNTAATFSAPGLYVLRLTASDGAAQVSDDLTVAVNHAPIVQAGPDLSLLLADTAALRGAVEDDGLPATASLAFIWTQVEGPGIARFANSRSLVTTATFSEPGLYRLQLVASDTRAAGGDALAVTVHPSAANQAPTVQAGVDLIIGQTHRAVLSGRVADDNFDLSGQLLAGWSVVSGPGVVTFADAAAPRTAADFSEPGTYVLRLSAHDGVLTASDDLSVTLHPDNLPPFVEAGPDRVVTQADATNCFITAESRSAGRIVVNNDDWALSDVGFDTAPGAGRFALNVAAWFTGGRPGRFLAFSSNFGLTGTRLASTLRAAGHTWTVSTSAPFTLTNLLQYDAVWLAGDPVDRQALVDYVKAGGCVYLAGGAGASFPGGEEAYWDVFLRPFGLDFGPSYNGIKATVALRSAHFVLHDVPSLYFENGNTVAELNPASTSTGMLAAHAQQGLLAVYEPAAAPLRLEGSAIDDGLPPGASLDFRWSVVSGPGAVTFGSSNAASSAVIFGLPGVYVLRLTASDSELAGQDDVTITVTGNQPPVVDAGADLALTLPEQLVLQGTVTDDGYPAGGALLTTWSLVSGPGDVEFANPHALTTSARFGAPGNYVLQLEGEDSELYGFDQLDVKVHLPALANFPGLLSWWPLDGTSVDGEGATAGQVLGDAVYAPGRVGLALNCDGTNDALRITSPQGVVRPASGLTLEGWIHPLDVTASRSIAEWTDGAGLTAGRWWIGYGGPGTLYAALPDTGGVYHAFQTPAHLHPSDPRLLRTNRFQHVALTYDRLSGLGTLYLDGIISAQASLGSYTPKTGQTLHLGGTISQKPFLGLLDECALYNRALTADEIRQIVHAGANGRNKTLRVAAGSDDAVVLPESAVLNAAVRGGSLLTGGLATVAWSALRGPGTVTFSNPDAPATSAAFDCEGDYVLRLSAQDSTGTASDDVRIQVYRPGTPNQPPTADAGPDFATSRRDVVVQGAVADDDLPGGSPLTVAWSKVNGPGTVSFADPAAARTTATFSTPGAYVLRLTATDSARTHSDDVTITILPNLAPVVDAGPDQSTTTGTISLNASVSDDALPGGPVTVAWAAVNGPGQVTIDDSAALATFAHFAVNGLYLLRLTASDGERETSDDLIVSFNGPTNLPPHVHAGPDAVVSLTQPVPLSGTATDDGLPFGTLTLDWSCISGPGSVAFSLVNGVRYAAFSDPGAYVLRCTASDSQLASSDDVAYHVLPPTGPPAVALIAPADDATITAPAAVTGTASSPILDSWKLQYRPAPSPALAGAEAPSEAPPWTTFASGTNSIGTGPLATFDPTLLLNGLYELRLVATDRLGQTSSTDPVALTVDGQFKVGHLALSFLDLSVPLAGLPIEIARTYDSRNQAPGDFGVGWTLDVRNIRLQKNRPLGQDWEETTTGSLWPVYALDPVRPRIVTISFPDGRLSRFRLEPLPRFQPLMPIVYPQWHFVPLPGTCGTLAPAGFDDPDGSFLIAVGSIPGPVDLCDLNFFTTHPLAGEADWNGNPTLFRYTTPEGYRYEIDELEGLRSLQDPHGNTLLIGADAITWTNASTGAHLAVSFQRDPLGRITRLADPAGASLRYAYDEQGNLAAFVDRSGQTWTFSYDRQHHLLAVADPRGVVPARNVFDDAGRLVRQTDAFGRDLDYAHDLDHRQEGIRDRLGNLTVHHYDDRGNILRTVAPDGGVTRFAYDDRDNLLQTVDPLGRTNSFTYDEADNRTSATDPLGHTTRYSYDARRRITSITDPLGRTVTNRFDPRGNLLETRDPLGHLTTFGYGPHGLPIAVTNALGGVTRFHYDALGRLTHEVDALGHTAAYARDAAGHLIQQTTTRTLPGNDGRPPATETLTVSFAYDPAGRLTNTVFADGSSARTVFNALGKPAVTIDPLGRQTFTEYDELGRVVRIVHPDGTSDGYAYDAEGRCVASTNRLGQVTRHDYDAAGRLWRTLPPDAPGTTNWFDPAGQLVAASDARGLITSYGYDAAGRCVAVTNASGEVSRSLFDDAGNLVQAIDPLGQTTSFVYDALNRRVQTLSWGSAGVPPADSGVSPEPLSGITTTYDPLGRLLSQTDPATNITGFGYDLLGRLTSVTNALGFVTRYAYDELGHRVAQTDAEGRTTRFDYDALGRRTRRALPLGQTESCAYDLAGRLASRTDFNGFTTTFHYDAMNRLVAKTPDPRRGEPPVTYAYNALGLRTHMADAAGTTTYEYGSRNRLTRKTRSWVGTSSTSSLVYTYDPNGNLTRLVSSNPNGTDVAYEYDERNRLKAVHDARLGRTGYHYDQVGNLRSCTRPNALTSFFEYDPLHRLTNLVTRHASLVTAHYAYTVGPAGQRLAAAETLPGDPPNGGVATLNRAFAYDPLYRLTGEAISVGTSSTSSLAYTYDPVGNRLTRSVSNLPLGSQSPDYDLNDRLTSDHCDANGNTLLGIAPAPGAGVGAPPTPLGSSYDFENRLTHATSVEGKTIDLAYDGDGYRVSKTVATGTHTLTTYYVVDDLNPTGHAQILEELVTDHASLVTPAIARVYTWGHTLLAQDQFNGTAWTESWYDHDGHGNVRCLVDAQGQITDSYHYDAFGNLIARSGDTPNVHLFCAEPFDADLGLYYLRARYLNPDTGRFWSADSFEGFSSDPASLHPYAYCANDPVNRLDPSGRMAIPELTISSGLWSTARTIFGGSIGGMTGSLASGYDSILQGRVSNPELAQAMAVGFKEGAAAGAFFGFAGGLGRVGQFGVSGIGMVYSGIGALAAYQSYSSGNIEAGDFESAMAAVGLLGSTPGVARGSVLGVRGLTSAMENYYAGPKAFLNVRRIPAELANEGFPAESAPYLGDALEFQTGRATYFVRIRHTRNIGKPQGGWLAPVESVLGRSRAELKTLFALEGEVVGLQPVRVPAGTHMRVGRVGPQPGWGVNHPGDNVQYQLLDQIDPSYFSEQTLPITQ